MPSRSRSLLVLFFCLCVFSGAVAWQQETRPQKPLTLLPVLKNSGVAYWKGNLHTHSFWSDGDDFPEMIADWYERHDYHFLALTDHNKLSEGERWLDLAPKHDTAMSNYVQRFGSLWVERRKIDEGGKGKEQVRLKPLSEFRSMLERPGKFLLIQGEEVTHKFAKNPVHMNATNLRNPILPVDGGSVRETVAVNLRQIADQQAKTGNRILAVLNHPNFGWGVTIEDMLTEELKYFEVFNGHPGVKNYGDKEHPGTERMWDVVLAYRLGKQKLPLVYGLGTDDAHNYHMYGPTKSNPGRAWIMVRAPYLSADAILRGMEAGDFYSSTGVVLADVHQMGKEFTVKIQAETGVRYKTQFIVTPRNVSFDSQVVKDAKGVELPVSRVYSPEIGKMVLETDTLESTYKFTGQELYVRAKILSSKAHPNPFLKGDMETAWTQPHVEKAP